MVIKKILTSPQLMEIYELLSKEELARIDYLPLKEYGAF